MTRLTDQQRVDRSLTEAEWQGQVTDLAEILGWSWAHFRPGRTAHGWRTPVSGPLGAGFPDLVLAHPRQHRVVYVETKRETGKTEPEQESTHELLRASGAEVYVWRPSDVERAIATLREYEFEGDER